MTWVIILAAFMLINGYANAGDESFCTRISSQYKNREFAAKVPLYDTKIGLDGVVDLERDKEEIPEGKKFVVKRVKCGSSKITFVLDPLDHYYAKKNIEIYFKIPKKAQEGEQGMESFQKMTSFVFEEAQKAEPEKKE
jgi:hypothetical protein